MFPVLFKLGPLNIYAYGFFVALGFATGAILCVLKAQNSEIKISFEQAVDLFFYSVVSAIVGSRLLFVLVNFERYVQNPSESSCSGETPEDLFSGRCFPPLKG